MDFADGSHDSSYLQNLHHKSHYPSRTSSTSAAYGVLFLIFIYYALQYLDYTNLPLLELLWNSLVYLTPSRVVSALDSGFERMMAQDLQDDNTGFNSKAHASKSNTMRRILGLDSSGILTTIQRTRTISNVGSVFKARPSNILPGLGNWDNSCYQNSVLQGLAALEALPAFLKSSTEGASGPTQKALNETIARLNDPANAGKTVWTPAALKSMSSWQQQDAQEYFSKISDELEKDTARAARKSPDHSGGLENLLRIERSKKRMNSPGLTSTTHKDRSDSSEDTTRVERLPEEVASLIVRNPLEGLLAQRVGCQQCGYVEGLSLVPFNCLTVPLGMQWLYDVRSCLDEYTALEPINGVECAKCTLLRAKQQMEQLLSNLYPDFGTGDLVPDEATEALRFSIRERLNKVTKALEDENFSDQVLKNCQIPSNKRVSTTKTRQAVIARSPRCLVLHVNRSNFDELTGIQSKNSATVKFPQQLDLAPWCLGRDPSSVGEDKGVETWNVDPSKSMLPTEDSTEGLESKNLYELRAVITHYGRHENGHYICYRRSPYASEFDDHKNGEHLASWWRLSDEDVSEVDESTVLAQGGVFMLFYEQMTPLVSQEEPHLVVAEVNKELQAMAEDVQPSPSSQNFDVLEALVCDESGSAKLVQEMIAPSSTTPASLVLDQAPTEDTELYTSAANSQELQDNAKVEPVAATRESQYLSQTSPNVKPPATSAPASTKTQLSPAAAARPSSPAPAQELKQVARPTSTPERKGIAVEFIEPTLQFDTHKENQPVTPLSMRTASPRSSRGSGSRAGKAMGSVAGFVQAN